MVKQLAQLSAAEAELVLKAPALVSVLIAGADSKIDKEEQHHAVEVVKLKSSRASEDLIDYFKEISGGFEKVLKDLISSLPSGTAERNKYLVAELSKLNAVLPKLEYRFAIQLHDTLKDFAKQVAETSGGFLGYNTISKEEKEFIDLNMINRPEH